MATESLNAHAAEFRPQAHVPTGATSESAERRRSRGKSNRARAARDDGATPPSGAPTQGNGLLVPAAVQRRRKPANGKNSSAEESPSRANGNKEARPAQPRPKKPSHGKQQRKAGAVDEKHDDDEREACLLCADPIEFHAVGECNHHGICSKCSLRMRMLMNDRSCPICKQNLERVVVCKEKRNFDTFQLWGDAAAGGRESVMDDASEIIFYECRSHYNVLRALRDFACRIKKCRVVCGSLQKLKDHLRIEHASEFCDLCLSHQHFFIQEQQVFSKSGLHAHNVGRNRSIGPKSSGKDFHPMCQFCKRRYYSDMQLYEHLERDHFRCHICKTDHDYFRNYASLEAHFRRDHHLCEDPACLENRYVVFANDIEYHAHMRNIHGVMNRLVLNFQVARSGENPLGGPPTGGVEEIPDSWNFESQPSTVPNRAVRQQDVAFPALPPPSAPAPVIVQPAIAPRATASRVSSSSAQTGPPRAQIIRNQRLAEALGLARPGQSTEAFEEEMKTPSYPANLVEWAKGNLSYLQVVERRLERIVQDASCHSVSLRPMPAEERALMHQLAEFYGVPSESFGEDPFRRISFFKRDSARVPEVTLSKFLRGPNANRTASSTRLSFLPMRGQPSTQPAAPRPTRPPTGISRGWEKIEPKPKRPVVADAWSDDEGEENAEPDREGAGEPQRRVAFDDSDEEEKRPVAEIKPVALAEILVDEE